jgi:hypothetical protein
MGDEDIPLTEYELYARRFQPPPNAPRAWARLARDSGMRDMVMPTEHHEGFCQFDSKLTDYCGASEGPRECGRKADHQRQQPNGHGRPVAELREAEGGFVDHQRGDLGCGSRPALRQDKKPGQRP